MQQLLKRISDRTVSLCARFNDHVRHTRLSNGIELASQRRFIGRNIHFEVMVKAGSFEDPQGQSGLAHFLEHVIATPHCEEFEKRRGFLNASTSADRISLTGYIPKSSENLAYLLTAISSALGDPLDSDVFSKEQRRIKNEIGMYNDMAANVHHRFLKRMIANSGEAYDYLGTVQNINDITIEDLETYKATWFKGANIFIGITGISDHQPLHDLCEEKLINVPTLDAPNHFMPRFLPVDFRDDSPAVHQLYFDFGMAVPVFENPRQESVYYLARSYLNTKVRKEIQEEGYAYYIGATIFKSFDNSGVMVLRGNALPEDADQLAPRISRILAEASTQIDQDIFDLQKHKILDNLKECRFPFFVGHSSFGMANDLATTGRVLTNHEETEIIERISARDVQNVIAEMVERGVAITAYGDSSKLHSLKEFEVMMMAARENILENKTASARGNGVTFEPSNE